MSTSLQPQAALETAVLNAIIAGLSYAPSQAKRMFDGQPAPAAGNVFVSVWYDGRRDAEGRVSLNELFGVYVTTTIRFTQPFDRWILHRDDMEARNNAIRALIALDSWNYVITNAANVLAGFRTSSAGGTDIAPNPTPAGWAEPLVFQGFDPIEEVGPDWFNAEPNSGKVGIAQRVKFGKARRIQKLLTAS